MKLSLRLFPCACWVAVLAAAAPSSQAQTPPAAPAALDRAALISAKAAGAAMLTLARAGSGPKARLVAAGERGIVLLSDDNGSHWRQAVTPTNASLVALRFIDGKRGWAVGHMGVVLHTEDGGQTWRKQLDGRQAAQLALAAARNSGDEKAVAQAQYLVDDGPDKPFFDLHIDAEGKGFVVGAYNLIFRTEDGGASWQAWSGHTENAKGLHLYGIAKGGDAYYIVGEQGLLLRSTDGGQHFVAQASPYKGTWFGALAAANGDLLLYGLRGNAYLSRDQGKSWQQAATGTPVSLSAATQLADGRLVLASQSGQVLLSQDQGKHFAPLALKSGLPLANLIQADADNLVLASLRGVAKVPLGKTQ